MVRDPKSWLLKLVIFCQFSALGAQNEEDELQKRVNDEYREFGDIVQVLNNFNHDNLVIKRISWCDYSAMKWISRFDNLAIKWTSLIVTHQKIKMIKFEYSLNLKYFV